MTTYTFTCPLQGCGLIMTNHESTDDLAAENLVNQAKEHLRTVHPEIHKSDEEVNADIRSHMVTIES